MSDTESVKRPARRILAAIDEQPWAITEEALARIIAICERDHDVESWLAQRGSAQQRDELEALQFGAGRRLEGARNVTVRDGVAVLPIIGPIVRYADIFTEVSGMTSFDTLARDLAAAAADPTVRAIVAYIDTPGGTANGTREFAARLRLINDQVKPVTAYVGGQGASAGYWIGAAAGQVVIAPTAIVGSIGVVMTVIDTSARDARSGVRKLEIVSSRAPDKRPDVNTDEGRGSLRRLVDALEAVFIDDVAAWRGVTAETVETDFGRGGVLVGAAAVAVGMADRLGDFETTLADTAARAAKGKAANLTARAIPMSEKEAAAQGSPAPITADFIRVNHPTVAAAFMDAGRAEGLAEGKKHGAEAERVRIAAIQAHAAGLKGHDALVAKLIADGTAPDAAAAALLAAEKQKGETILANLNADRADAGKVPATPAAERTDPAPGADTIVGYDGKADLDKAKAAFAGDEKIRATFSSPERYAAYLEGVASGAIRHLNKPAA